MSHDKLAGLDSRLNNTFRTAPPYGWIIDASKINPDAEKKLVIFFGNDLPTLVAMGVDKDRYISQTNKCLDFVREHFSDCQLLFKPHPAGFNEGTLLDLSGFAFLEGKITSEIFLWQHHARIRCVFAIGSLSAANAYAMGLNAYLFSNFFDEIYSKELVEHKDANFVGLPKSLFLEDLTQKPKDNAYAINKNTLLERDIITLMGQHSGTIWFIVSTTQHLMLVVSLALMVRAHDPKRKIGLVISKHHRWDGVPWNDIKGHFDKIEVFPRLSYSMRLGKILAAIRTAFKIKQYPISSGDIICSVSQTDFIENCFVSYHKVFKVGLVTNGDFSLHYADDAPPYKRTYNFSFSRGSWFFNRILEPFLGLNRTIFMTYGDHKNYYLSRYQKPLNTIFDRLYISEVPKVD